MSKNETEIRVLDFLSVTCALNSREIRALFNDQAVCTKSNEGFEKKCVVCKRERNHIPSNKSSNLPFHPKCRNYQGAARSLEYSSIRAYLEAGFDPDTRDYEGWTGMHWAAALGRLDLIELYIKNGGDIEAQRFDGWTPLHIACYVGDAKAVLLLIQRGASLHALSHGESLTPLHVACQEGHCECIQTLAMSGADLNQKTKYGNFTPLHIISTRGYYDAANVLLAVSADPLRLAAYPNTEVDVNAMDGDGWSAYHTAGLKGFDKLMKLLVSYGAEDNTKLDTLAYHEYKCQRPKRFQLES